MVLPEDFEIPSQVQKVKDEVPHWLEFISVNDTEAERYLNDVDAPSGKAHALMYLNSRHWNQDKDRRTVLVNSNSGSGASRQKTYQSRRYNRMVFFADCLNPGHVCCKILETHADTTAFFTNMINGAYGVGWVYIFEEPEARTDFLGGTDSISVLQGATRVYPVECNCCEIIPPCPLQKPDAGETKYFAYHGCKEMAIGGTILRKATCGGRFCDRQITAGNVPGGVVPCGCFHRTDRHRVVTESALHIPCEANVSENKRDTIHKFRSLRFDELLFEPGSRRVFEDVELGDPIVNIVLRTRFFKLVDHVNKRHGWTIIGWVRTGKVRDANEEGNRDAEDIAAEDVKPHITYLYPTDPKDVDPDEVEEFRALLITEDSFRREMKEEEQRRNQSKKDRNILTKRKQPP